VKSFSLDANRELNEGRFVCLRRANDVSQNDSFSPSPTITKHDNQEFGTHHARDVYELFDQGVVSVLQVWNKNCYAKIDFQKRKNPSSKNHLEKRVFLFLKSPF
jgi:hypothetical protein